MKWQNQRKAFSMLTAIVVIVLMATVAMLVMSMSAKLVKETTAQYQREQAVLLANSYTEYAVMAVTANDRSINCLSTIKGTVGNATASNPNDGYRIRTHIAYIGIDYNQVVHAYIFHLYPCVVCIFDMVYPIYDFLQLIHNKQLYPL